MALTSDDKSFLKLIYNRLKPEEPLDPGDPRYESVYDRPGCDDPTSEIFSKIQLSDRESTLFFSGFSGSGKTTELRRLRKRLLDEGYFVLYADALDYINPALPIQISDLLIVLAGAFSEALEEQGINIGSESYWTRLYNYLKNTNVELNEISVKSAIDPISAGLGLKLELRSTPSFRQRLATALADRVGSLQDDVLAFFEDGYKAIQRDHDGKEVVFIFDSLEQIRASLSAEQAVIQSVESLFSNHVRMLSIPWLHMVYTVPPWLKFVLKGVNMTVIPCIRTWKNDGKRDKCDDGIRVLREFVHKRLEPGGAVRLLGPDYQQKLEDLIMLSGGHFRDLLRLIRSVIEKTQTLPADERTLDRAILDVRSSFLPIAVEDAVWLDRIALERASPLTSDSASEVNRLTKFLDSHVVLFLRNGEEWYDIHPLLRDEVTRIVAANRASTVS